MTRTGFGAHLFHDWRFDDDAGTQPTASFVLNKPEFKGTSILLARENFGCGSSREHAPWADRLRFSRGDCAEFRRHFLR